MHPLVSILIPLYNHQDYIIPCLESVCNETYPAKELIIIDDGSTDKSAERVQAWLATNPCSFPVKFISRPNKGVSATLNELLELSSGEFIALLASDDLLVQGGIEARLNYLLDHPEKLLAVGDCYVIDMDGALIYTSGIEQLHCGRRRYLANEELIVGELIFRWCLAGPVYLFRRSFVSETGGYDHSLALEDWDICLRLGAKGQIGYVDTAVAAYRWHPGCTSRLPEKEIALLVDRYRTAVKNRHLFSGLYWWHLWVHGLHILSLIAHKRGAWSRFPLSFERKIRKLTESLFEKKAQRVLSSSTVQSAP